ncbi:MAG: PssD/Cps14F family polysaccharide biosynthesis glycosyltransferase [Candidatus Diapherotrites archaeon]
MKLCLACSAGGHLAEIMALKDFYSNKDHFFLTFERQDTKSLAEKEKVVFVTYPQNFFSYLASFIDCVKVILKEKPQAIISTGSHVGIFACLIGKFLGKKVVFIESFCRTKEPSKSGKIAYLFADLFIYQWKDLQKFYPKGVYGGSIF